jgi:hypothetical protein
MISAALNLPKFEEKMMKKLILQLICYSIKKLFGKKH